MTRLDRSAPGEAEAQERAWAVTRAAFLAREPVPRRRRRGLVSAAVVAIAAPARFDLPPPGRLLVVSAEGGGLWLVREDGSKRRLGDYDDGSWSPRGLFVVATRRNELRALEPDGEVRWGAGRRSEVRLLATPTAKPVTLFPAAGALGGLTWSPDGRWLLVQWPDADQWVFIRPGPPRRLRAVAGMAAQFPRPDGRPPLLLAADRWCCVERTG